MKVENIKFKAKRLDGKGWAIGDLLHSYENGAIIVPIEGGGAFSVNPDTICQFTELEDCEGNEIWEGDLLQSQITKTIYEVNWYKFLGFTIKIFRGGSHLETLDYLLRLGKFKVIGNKFDKEK